MFTGIIEEVGRIDRITPKGRLKVLSVQCTLDKGSVKLGDSIAINGVCLTVTDIGKATLTFDVMGETLDKSSLSSIKQGAYVNIERALKPSGNFSGHFVYGHIDRVRKIAGLDRSVGRSYLDISIADDDAKFIVPKGSVALDGISLTVGEITPTKLRVFIIPHTWKHSNLQYKKTGDPVNIEFDIIGKYVLKNMSAKSTISERFLRDAGII